MVCFDYHKQYPEMIFQSYHHKYQDNGHRDDHTQDIVVMEEERNKRESDGRDKSTDKNIGHSLSDRTLCFI